MAASSMLQDYSTALAGIVTAAAPSVASLASGRTRLSGFVWRPGLLVTAEEPLPDEAAFAVTFSGGASAEAKLVGRDPSTDIALLRLTGTELSPLRAASGALSAGNLAIAVGALEGTATAAVGAVSRAAGPWRSLRGGEISARIELDLRLPGSGEGAAVLDASGGLLGMAVRGPRRRVLVIPAATIDRVAAQLEKHGRIPRGYLGVGLHPVAIGDEGWGAMVMSLDAAGPAAAAGLHQGDIIVGWNGQPMGRIRNLLEALGSDSIGKPATLKVRRGAGTEEVRLTIAERPAA
jgi:S1-C subfamily serine protease